MELFREIHIRLVTKNALSLFVIRAFSSLASFVIATLLVTNLGYSHMGTFSKITAFVSILYVVLDGGMNPIYLKEFASSKEHLSKFISLRLIISFIIIFLITSASLILPYPIFQLSDPERIGLLLFSLSLLPFGVQLSISPHFQSEFTQIKTIIPNLVSTAVLLSIAGFGIATRNLYLILLAYPVSGLVLSLALLMKTGISFTKEMTSLFSFFKGMLKSSLPFSLVFLINVVYSKIDILTINALKTNTEVGIYGYSYRIFELFLTIPLFFSASMYPLIISSRKSSQWLKIAQKYTIFLFFLSIPSVIGLFVFSFLFAYLNPSVSSSMTPLRLLSFSLPFFFTTSVMQWILIKEGKVVFLLTTYSISFIFVLILNLLFIPRFSYNASAVITGLGEGLVWVLFMAYFAFHYPKFIRNRR